MIGRKVTYIEKSYFKIFDNGTGLSGVIVEIAALKKRLCLECDCIMMVYWSEDRIVPFTWTPFFVISETRTSFEIK